ncbi:MAG: AI-2E family transporter, partial [Acidobacteria bacterium]|nr:AI-2E family transporter [Acidobacteriota bacterium]
MNPEPPASSRSSALLSAAGVVIIVAGLKAAAELLLPLVFALFLAAFSLPLVAWLERHRVPRTLAVLITVLADFAILVCAVLLVAGQFNAFTAAWPRYQARLGQIADST